MDVVDNKKRQNSTEQHVQEQLSTLSISDHEHCSEPHSKKARVANGWRDDGLQYLPEHSPGVNTPEFCMPIDQSERCTAGNHPALNPYTAHCGHTYCGEALQIATKLNIQQFVCIGKDEESETGICNEVVQVQDLLKLKDTYVEKSLKKKLVKCSNKDKGCKEEMTLREHSKHISVCQFTKVPCPNCNKQYQRHNLPKHQAKCKSKACELAALGCKHVSESGASTSTATTPEHSTGLHLALLYQLLASVRDVAGFSARSVNAAINSHIQSTLGQEQTTQMIDRPDEQQAAHYRIGELKHNYNNKLSDASAAKDRFRYMVHEDFPKKVAEPVLRVKHQSQLMQDQEQEKTEQMKSFMKETLDAPLLLNHGCIIFKIANFSELRTKAIKGELKRGVYGPLFYTHEFGYLMVPIVYPNGDGAGAGTHASVFIAIKKGRYDALLHWPVSGKVSISILSQRKVGHETVSHTFNTDLASLSYHRPTNDMNQASGIPRALDLNLLKQPSDFLVDDTLFVQIVVKSSLSDD